MKQDNLSDTFRSISKSAPIPPAEVVQHLLGLCGKRKWHISNLLKLSQQTVSNIINATHPTPSQIRHRREIARILSDLLSQMMGQAIEIRSRDIWSQADGDQAAA